MVKVVTLTRPVRKTLRKNPGHVVVKLLGWVDTEVSKHDY